MTEVKRQKSHTRFRTVSTFRNMVLMNLGRFVISCTLMLDKHSYNLYILGRPETSLDRHWTRASHLNRPYISCDVWATKNGCYINEVLYRHTWRDSGCRPSRQCSVRLALGLYQILCDILANSHFI